MHYPPSATHLEESINVSNGGDVLWYEWFQLRLQVYCLGSVPRDVLEEFLQLTAHRKMLKFCRIIGTSRRKKGREREREKRVRRRREGKGGEENGIKDNVSIVRADRICRDLNVGLRNTSLILLLLNQWHLYIARAHKNRRLE